MEKRKLWLSEVAEAKTTTWNLRGRGVDLEFEPQSFMTWYYYSLLSYLSQKPTTASSSENKTVLFWKLKSQIQMTVSNKYQL